ncbi:hypothetical protein M9458_037496, partial [Cirrhinus mrigala]
KTGHGFGPLLTGEAQRAYFSLPAASADRYVNVKREILGRLGLSPVCAAQYFYEWEYKPRLPAHAQVAELSRLAHNWLLEGDPTAEQVAERVVIDWLLRALPHSHRQAIGMRNPSTTLELVEAIVLADAAQQRDAGEVVQEQRAPEGTQNQCPWRSPRLPPGTGWQAASLTATGSRSKNQREALPAVSLVRSHLLPPCGDSKALLRITCVHRETRQVPARRVTISAAPGTWPVEVGLMKDLPTGPGLTACSRALPSLPVLEGAAKDEGRPEDHASTP